MTVIIPDVLRHTVIICVDQRERGIALQIALQAEGHRVFVTLSLYEALQTITQELPHLVIAESKLADGNAGLLYDKMQEIHILKGVPILACVLRKTREELAPLANRQFAGFVVGRPDPATIVPKADEILSLREAPSPYFIKPDVCQVKNLVISTDATAIGKTDHFIVVSSDNEVDYESHFHCTPHQKNKAAVTLKTGLNLTSPKGILNLFPIHKILGSGREWVEELSTIKISDSVKKIAIVNAHSDELDQWIALLEGQNFQCEAMPKLGAVLKAALTNPFAYRAIMHFGQVPTQTLQKWANLHTKSPGKLPPILMLTDQKTRRFQGTTALPFPCALGDLYSALEALSLRQDAFLQAMTASAGTLHFTYRNRVHFLGLDESGGFLQSKVPFHPGNRVKAEHPFFDDVFQGQLLTIQQCAPVNTSGLWQMRFEAAIAGQSKARRWEKIIELVSPNHLAS